MNKMIGRSVGFVLMVLGAMGSIVGVLGIVDPEGTQLSNDADPFGEVPGIAVRFAFTAGWLIMAALGSYFLFRMRRK